MCGIVGVVSKDKNTLPVLIDGLKRLEYRGYDSAGIAYQQNKELHIIKAVGKIESLKSKTDITIPTSCGIGHTRWATHGVPNLINCHPHSCGDITIVHNGIIENYTELRTFLELNNYSFKTDTDTEVAATLLDFLYQQKKSMIKSLQDFRGLVTGSYALGILCKEEPDTIYAIRCGSPLVIGKNENSHFIASDPLAINTYAKQIHYLEEGMIAILKNDSLIIYNHDKKIMPDFKDIQISLDIIDKQGYDHYMLKEIHEQAHVFEKIITPYFENGIDSLLEKMPDLSSYQEFHLVACGSAYHTGLIGKYLIEKYAKIPVSVQIASEYRYQEHFYNQKTLVILISQSGETADTLASLRKAKKEHIDTLAIVNVANSSIAREADQVLEIQAGPEIAVATTKAYSGQVTILSLIALYLSYYHHHLSKKDFLPILKDSKNLPHLIEETIQQYETMEVVNQIYQNKDIFFIGRGIDYALCMEGSLKLKEISYIHSEAYPAGELKHGTISLLENNTPVISIVTDDTIREKTENNIEEVKARNAFTIYIGNQISSLPANNIDACILVPKVTPFFQPLLTVIPLQLLAYQIAKKRGCDIDQPKHLAKSVTVE